MNGTDVKIRVLDIATFSLLRTTYEDAHIECCLLSETPKEKLLSCPFDHLSVIQWFFISTQG